MMSPHQLHIDTQSVSPKDIEKIIENTKRDNIIEYQSLREIYKHHSQN